MATFDLKSYARRGAEVRLGELKEEMNAIYATFPDLRSGARVGKDGATLPNGQSRRRRTRMSAAQRKAVGERMRKYWASRRAAKK